MAKGKPKPIPPIPSLPNPIIPRPTPPPVKPTSGASVNELEKIVKNNLDNQNLNHV